MYSNFDFNHMFKLANRFYDQKPNKIRNADSSSCAMRSKYKTHIVEIRIKTHLRLFLLFNDTKKVAAKFAIIVRSHFS